jgi:hypothetical protein
MSLMDMKGQGGQQRDMAENETPGVERGTRRGRTLGRRLIERVGGRIVRVGYRC